jgi:NTP pyrophosphatase (non-canonical NTP hydrolase)
MKFSEIQHLVSANADRYAKKHGINIDSEFLMLKLMEETGEVAEAMLAYFDRCRIKKRVSKEDAREALENELADVLGVILLLATEHDLDILEALERKTLSKGRKYLESQQSEEKKDSEAVQ